MVAPVPLEKPKLSRSLVRVPGSGSDKRLEPFICDLRRVSSEAETVSINLTLPPILTNQHNTTPVPQPTPVAIYKGPAGQKLYMRYSEDNQAAPQRYTEARRNPKYTSASTVTRKSPRYTSSSTVTRRSPRYTSSPPVYIKNPRYTRSSSMVPSVRPTPSAMPPPGSPRIYSARKVELPTDLLANRPGRLVMMPIRQVLEQRSNILHVTTKSGPVLLKPVARKGVTTRSQSNRERNQGRAPGQPGTKLMVTTLQEVLNEQSNLVHQRGEVQRQVEMLQQLFQDPEKLKIVAKEIGIKLNKLNG
ncbi:hypothetical protein Pmani_013932 [Petrolisthes manimaculis]|uniref:Uncharacterized protein n=1 Tax=Petrolisthes manimaculis TaxID=1843537 RepID=A0AAE1U8W4_9EUCA|nr:hypothetical protein Pmani_013932 [Petrolisthes manimaculis]